MRPLHLRTARAILADETLPARLAARLRSLGKCLRWTGAHDNNGYGQITVRFDDGPSRPVKVHSAVWVLKHGAPPQGTVLTRTCGNRDCVSHLEPIRAAEYARSSIEAYASKMRDRTQCSNGHEFTPETTGWRPPDPRNGKRYRLCLVCRRQWARAAYLRRSRQG